MTLIKILRILLAMIVVFFGWILFGGWASKKVEKWLEGVGDRIVGN